MSEDGAVEVGGGEEPAAVDHGISVKLPGDWVSVDTGTIRRWKQQAEESRSSIPPNVMALMDASAGVFETQGPLLSAFLLERGSVEALATMACYLLAMPALPTSVDFAEQVRGAPPADAVDGTFEVGTDERVGALRSRCLRRSVLEVPTKDDVSLAVEYFLPVPGGEAVVVAGFSTPHVKQDEKYCDLFSTIASSIVIS